MKKSEKKWLLDEIKELITYSSDESIEINESYLDFFSLSDLYSLKESLEHSRDNVNSDNLEWLEKFKYERK